jgi:oligopeptide/dipeptide ABC transporter ATP-binding protein
MEGNEIVLEVKDLATNFKIGGEDLAILKGVSFNVMKGKALAIVGESGCGKSVTVHSVMRLLPNIARLSGGTAVFRSGGREWELHKLEPFGKEMRAIRGSKIGMIFQDPMASLNPVYRVGDQVAENLLQHNPKMPKSEAMGRIAEMFKSLGIPDPEHRVRDYPHQFSGGMKQRVMIAIAMICNPELLIADEPTTALDVTIQAQIMELMMKLKEEQGKAIVLITHNMGLVAETADDVAVMYMGRIVEYGNKEQIFHRASHPYTKALLRSVPVLGRSKDEKLETIRGSTPGPSEYLTGCEFRSRCDFATQVCQSGEMPNVEIEPGHFVRCVLFSERRAK